MPYGTSPLARALEYGPSNRFLAALPPRRNFPRIWLRSIWATRRSADISD
jgi:hypothetical protein